MAINKVQKATGLTKIELAALYGVSRQTIHYWQRVGPPRSGTYTARMAETITAALIRAVEKKILPFGAMSREARQQRIERMARTLQGLKPAPQK